MGERFWNPRTFEFTDSPERLLIFSSIFSAGTVARERAITEQKFSRMLRDASVKAFLLKRRANRLRTHSRRTTALNRTCKFYRLNRAARPVAEIIIPVSLRSLPYSLLSNTPLRTTSTTSYTVITPTAFVPLSKVRSSIIESCKISNCR